MSDADSPAGTAPGWPGWVDETQVWHAGLLLGWLMRHAAVATPVMDDEGNYTDKIDITLMEGPKARSPSGWRCRPGTSSPRSRSHRRDRGGPG